MLWLEIRCDDREERDDGKCSSHKNAGPFSSAWPINQKTLIAAYNDLMKQAKAEGWKKIDSEWICANCANAK